MPRFEVKQDETVAIITMNSGENRFNPNFIQAFLGVLDTVENETDASAAVITSAHEKIFSNGLDLDWIQPVIKHRDEKTYQSFFHELNRLSKRLVTYPLLTVAAISGHAFALGAVMCGAFDFRFMRADRGYFCLPAIDLGLPFLPSMLCLLRKAVPRHLLEELILTGKRISATECEAHRIIQKALPMNDLMPAAITFAKQLNKKREIVAEMKTRWNKEILHAATVEDAPYIASGIEKLVL